MRALRKRLAGRCRQSNGLGRGRKAITAGRDPGRSGGGAHEAAVLSIEFKLNLLTPAIGDRIEARARVLRAGRTISVCTADAFAIESGVEKRVATMMGTMMCVRENPALRG
jgi:acyl-coenzyme A thioesterase PaaI-like protein